MNSAEIELPLFPLNTVLFPHGFLPLKIFEQRYMEMAKGCLRDGTAFGVCSIREGNEVGAPAVPARVGCFARIVEWDMPQLGVLEVIAQGEQRFRLRDYHANEAGLLIGSVERIDDEPATEISEEFAFLNEVASEIASHTNEKYPPTPEQLADAVWLSYRLSELLPLPLALKQQLLELTEPNTRLFMLREMINSAAEDEP